MNLDNTLGDVHSKLKIMSKNHFDELVRVRDIQFNSMDEIMIGSSTYNLHPTAQQGMAYRMGGVPLSYLRKCPPDLAAMNLNHWLTEEKNEELFFRFDGKHVRAVLSTRYSPINHLDVVEHLIKEMAFTEDTQVDVAMDSSFMSLSIPNAEKSFSVRGDEHQAGISISNSEVGISALHVGMLLYRLICSNGMVSQVGAGKKSFRHVGSTGVLEDLPKHIKEIATNSTTQSNQLAISMDSHVDDPESTFREFYRRWQVSKEEKKAVEWGYLQEPGFTMFSVIQAFTRGSQFNLDFPVESAHKLQVIGGRILNMVKQ